MNRETPAVLSPSTLLVAIDDTDTLESEYGTGKVSRFLGSHLESQLTNLSYRGSVRQQLLIDPRIPYTTHNSAACLIVEWPEDEQRDVVIDTAATFLEDIAADGSDPGLCVGRFSAVSEAVRNFGIEAENDVVDESRAYRLAANSDLFLEEYGGTGEGVIGALAAVGRTKTGEMGRFIDFGDVRSVEGDVSVSALQEQGVSVRTTDGSRIQEGTVETESWVRPDLRDRGPTLLVTAQDDGRYRPINLDE